ncbi:MAG: BlaI/MecI/CopY family transcriptional regulator [Solirubrobacteraceae bacterium]
MAGESSEAAPPALHELEGEVMEELWRLGEAPVRPVLDALNASSARSRAYTTVMTVMAKLHRKGVLARRREGKTDVYRPVLTRDAYMEARARADLDAMLDRYGDVALVALARQMDELDPKRREQLQRLARGE